MAKQTGVTFEGKKQRYVVLDVLCRRKKGFITEERAEGLARRLLRRCDDSGFDEKTQTKLELVYYQNPSNRDDIVEIPFQVYSVMGRPKVIEKTPIYRPTIK